MECQTLIDLLPLLPAADAELFVVLVLVTSADGDDVGPVEMLAVMKMTSLAWIAGNTWLDVMPKFIDEGTRSRAQHKDRRARGSVAHRNLEFKAQEVEVRV